MKDSTIRAAYIGGFCVILAAVLGGLIQKYGWPLKSPQRITIAGMVIDQQTNRGIGQATIYVVGRPEQYRTEDNGNFRFTLATDSAMVFRLNVTKAGYQPLDRTVQLPAEDLTLILQKQ